MTEFETLPAYWVHYDTVSVVVNGLLGKLACANRPISSLNPNPFFTITDVKIEDGVIFVRGENTMWFEQSIVKIDVLGM